MIDADPFAGGGTVWHDERIGELRPQAAVRLNARTAADAKVRDGDVADLAAGERTMSGLTVRIDDRCIDGTLAVVDGVPSAPASALFDGESVSLANVRAAAREEALA